MFGNLSEKNCLCGKEHIFTSKVVTEKGAINKLPLILKEIGGVPDNSKFKDTA